MEVFEPTDVFRVTWSKVVSLHHKLRDMPGILVTLGSLPNNYICGNSLDWSIWRVNIYISNSNSVPVKRLILLTLLNFLTHAQFILTRVRMVIM